MLKLAPAVRLVVAREMPALDQALEARVERHWQAALARGHLFNGLVFCADTIEPDVITGHWTEYRRVVAQMAEAALVPVLRVRSLAVCGVLAGPSGVAVARRAAGAAYQAGLWQLPPAGSVDRSAAEPGGVSWQQALLTELREELGLLPGEVGAMRPLCLVQHPSGVLDMGVRIDTELEAGAILERHAASGDQEYDRVMVVAPGEVAGRVSALGGRLVPSVAPLLALAFGSAENEPGADIQQGCSPV